MNTQAKRIEEYDMLRVIVTLLVIVGHSTYYAISTPYGGINYAETFDLNTNVFCRISRMLSNFIYTFHMPLFMALSGGLFFRSIEKGKLTFRTLLLAKAKRLLIPFVIVTLLYSFPLKLVSGYYAESENILKDLILGQLLIQGNSHLWFLIALFLIFLWIFALESKIKGKKISKFLILFLLAELSQLVSLKLLQYPLQYAVWFYAGYCFEEHRNAFNALLKKTFVILNGAILAVSFYAEAHFSANANDLNTVLFIEILKVISIISGCIFTYGIAFYLSQTKIKKYSLYKVWANNSFGIYLYSDPWNYVILAIIFHTVGNMVFTSNVIYIFVYIGRIIITTTLAIITSLILRKFHLKYLV